MLELTTVLDKTVVFSRWSTILQCDLCRSEYSD